MRQTEIANLVVSGKSSRDIAKALFLSPRTVENHITAIFNKLGVRSRVELTAALLNPNAGADQPAIAASASSTNLPHQRTSLVGRETELADIVDMLHDSRLVTVTGAGGIGKTRMAVAVGEALLDRMKAGVWFVDLAPLAHGSFVVTAVAQALGVRESPDRPLQTLLAQLARKSLLLILDNCEHVIDEAAAFADTLLRGCPLVRILATSREPLRISGEQTCRLPSLQVPVYEEIASGLSACGAAGYAGVMLFTQRAYARDRGFALSDHNAPIVADICRRLDGIPLAIELAAARTDVLSVWSLSQKLDHRFQLLTGGDRTALPRHRTMRALIDWSYDLLSPLEQRLFEQLSIFVGGCTLHAAAAVCGVDALEELDVLELLTSLVDKSLAAADLAGREPRYWLQETSREYASEKLAGRGEATAVAHRHALAYVAFTERLDREHDVAPLAPHSAWFAQAELELENCRAALEWSLGARGDIVLGQRLVRAMWPVWTQVSPVEGRHWLKAAKELIDDRTPAGVAARLENVAAALAYVSGEFEAALASSRRAIVVCGKLGDAIGAARGHYLAGISLVNLGRVPEGEGLLQHALGAGRSLATPWLVALSLQGIAQARAAVGNLSEARAYLAEALEIYTAIGGGDYRAPRATMLLAKIEFLAGNREQAVQLSTRSLATTMPLFSFYIAAMQTDVAAYLIACDRWGDAHEHAFKALDLAREMQYDVALAWTIQHLAAIAALASRGDDPQCEKSENAARLLGYVDANIAALHVSRQFVEQQEYDRVLTLLSKKLGADELRGLMAGGAAMTADRAVQQARSI